MLKPGVLVRTNYKLFVGETKDTCIPVDSIGVVIGPTLNKDHKDMRMLYDVFILDQILSIYVFFLRRLNEDSEI